MMKTLMTKVKKRLEHNREITHSDSADATIITSMFLLPIVFFILVSIIDMAMFAMSDSSIHRAARDGASTAATLGGVGATDRYAYAEHNYGQRVNRTELSSESSRFGINFRNSIEVFVARDIETSNAMYEVELDNVRCFVNNSADNQGDWTSHPRGQTSTYLGQRPVCEVTWRYNGLPLSGWGMVQSRDDSGNIIPRETTGYATSDLTVHEGAFGTKGCERGDTNAIDPFCPLLGN